MARLGRRPVVSKAVRINRERAAKIARATMTDDRGNVIKEGDTVQVLYIDRDRGAELWMHQGTVVGLGRTRVKVQFPSRSDVSSVGPECLRVVA